MAKRKLKPIEQRDPYAALVMAAFDTLESENEIERPKITTCTYDTAPHDSNATVSNCKVAHIFDRVSRLGN